jgi:arginyl-tRNA synthetase
MENAVDRLSKDFFAFLASCYPETEYIENPHLFTINTEAHKKQFGDISSNVALLLAKQVKKNPIVLAKEIQEKFASELVEKIEVMGPGFLNLFLSDFAWYTIAQELFEQKSAFFKSEQIKKEKINIEFVSANPTGPLHFGHGRGGIIGDTLARMLTFLGHQVTKEFYINDAGSQIQKLGLSFKNRCLQQLGIPAAIAEDGYHGEYLIALAEECVRKEHNVVDKTDQFFTQYAQHEMLAMIKKTLSDYRISFDVWFSEKTLHQDGAIKEVLTELKNKGLLYFQDDAWWFCATRFGDDKDRVVERSNGELTYIAADIAYLKNKIGRRFDRLVMILGHDHHGYVNRLHASLAALGHTPELLDVILYQLVKITKEGSLVRMSKRSGTIVSLQDIIDIVSTDVARFFYLQKKADSQLEFDLELAIKKSEENPVFYIQYAYVRALNVIKKSLEIDTLKDIFVEDRGVFEQADRLLLRKIIALKYIFLDISNNYHTHLLAQATFEFAAEFHQFYAKHHILNAESVIVSRHRLFVVTIVLDTFSMLFDLLGISRPKKM